MPDAYLEIARRVLLAERRPLRPRTILRIAAEGGLLSPHLHGRTPHKTLGARLSEHIARYGDKAQFFRPEPGAFFLRELMDDASIPLKYRRPVHTRKRAKDLKREAVLTIPRFLLEQEELYGIIDDTERVLQLMRTGPVRYVERKKAEADYSRKQLVTYIVAFRGDEVLSYRREKYTTATDEIKGARSIGFGGHVADSDVDLWSPGLFGIPNNAVREFYEELNMVQFLSHAGYQGSFSLLSFINVDDTDEARRHLAAVVLFRCPKNFEPKKGELSINDLGWLPLSTPPNDPDDFELWSRLLLARLSQPDYRSKILDPRMYRTWAVPY